MIKNTLILFLALGFGACSSSKDAVVDAINAMPMPSAPNAEQNQKLTPQQIPDDVPGMKKGQKYYGKHKIKLGKKMQFELSNLPNDLVFDLEIQPKKDLSINLSDYLFFYEGDCNSETIFNWYQLDTDNTILDIFPMDIMSTNNLKKGYRYLLRVEFTGNKGCKTITNHLEFKESGV